MKVVIPVAGVGVKLRPLTHSQPKPLVPVAGKPILAHIVDNLMKVGLKDFVFIIGYMGDKIREFIEEQYGDQINAHFEIQDPRKGSAHALWCVRQYLEQEDQILIMLGDSIVDMNLSTLLESEENVVATQKVTKPKKFGIAEIDYSGYITRLVEKPLIPKSNRALVGVYKISSVSTFLKAVNRLIDENRLTHGEYQLTDALMLMIEEGERIKNVEVDMWFDCGQKDTLLKANAILLSQDGAIHSNSEPYPSCIFIQPVRIGEGCSIRNSVIGPNVAVGDHTKISNSVIQNTIIGSFSEIDNAVLESSIVGNDSTLRGIRYSLNIGDSTEINFAC